ncbi:MAG: AHH domain-containing protein, partial [Lentimicrobiaceae bacterium]|nr:AHH domain-containing protein [Lentimicrobiaceae bacterium]
VARDGMRSLPTQMHHFATIKNSRFTPEMRSIANQFGLDLNGAWNKAAMPHLGRHPNSYHKFVLKNMQDAMKAAGGNQVEFLQLYNKTVIQPVLDNPLLLRKVGWPF